MSVSGILLRSCLFVTGDDNVEKCRLLGFGTTVVSSQLLLSDEEGYYLVYASLLVLDGFSRGARCRLQRRHQMIFSRSCGVL